MFAIGKSPIQRFTLEGLLSNELLFGAVRLGTVSCMFFRPLVIARQIGIRTRFGLPCFPMVYRPERQILNRLTALGLYYNYRANQAALLIIVLMPVR
jgi:hypothetical protein